MKEKLRFLGLDVHAETIAVAIAGPDGEVRSLGTIPNRVESIRKMIKKLGPAEKLRACYEAGPTGYVVYWQMAKLVVQCEVVAPTRWNRRAPRFSVIHPTTAAPPGPVSSNKAGLFFHLLRLASEIERRRIWFIADDSDL